MKVDIRVPVGLPLPRLAEFVARCEDAGFDGVGIHDHPHRGRDAYVALALAAERTRRLRLYPATSSPVVRHPLLLASLVQTLDEVEPERHWREVLFLCDEYHSFATVGENDPSGDEKFFALSRQARCIPIVATQSISSLRSTLPGECWRTLSAPRVPRYSRPATRAPPPSRWEQRVSRRW